jgi:hypothetical protein
MPKYEKNKTYMNANTPEGWLHMFVAYKLEREACGSWLEVFKAITNESFDAQDPEYEGYMSDNQCIMAINKWCFVHHSDNKFIFNDREVISIKSCGVDYWRKRV